MTKLRHAIILGSIREGRFGDKPAGWLHRYAQGRERADYELIDLRDHPLPLFNEATSPAKGLGKNDAGNRWRSLLAGFDGFVFVTAEYNHSITGTLKNALDYVYPEMNKKPATFLGYGGVGAARAIEQLRLILVELQMAPLRNAVHISMPDFADLAKGSKHLEDLPYIGDGTGRMLDELEWWSTALSQARSQT